MSTPQSTTHDPRRHRTRLDAGLGALSALIAIGVIALFVALTGTERAGGVNGAIHHPHGRAHTRSVAVIPAGFNGFYADPATYGVQRARTAACNPAKLRQLRVEKPCYALP